MADVTFQREDYTKALVDWSRVADVCAGERKVKQGEQTYLPKPNPKDKSDQNTERYKQYLLRAVFYNATGNTLKGLVGTAFRETPALEVPTVLDYMQDDADGAGVSINQQARKTLSSVLQKGRKALYVDMPKTEGGASVADLKNGKVRANILAIDADQVINWKCQRFGSVYRLSQVVIRERVETTTEDGFGTESTTQYRVLELKIADDGKTPVYIVNVYTKDEQGKYTPDPDQFAIPRDGKNKTWDYIPLVFVGSENNDPAIDPAPLLDLANLNLAHYRNSADYEDSVYFVGQAQLVITGLTEKWAAHLEKTGIYAGSRTPLPLLAGGDAKYLQAEQNGMVKEAMDQKEKQMAASGARMLQKGSAVKTATEAQSDSDNEHSVLSLCAANVSEAYTFALECAAKFMNTTEPVSFELSQEFTESTLDAQMLTALVNAWQTKVLPEADLWERLRKNGLIDPEKTNDEIKEELEAQTENDLNLDGGNENGGEFSGT